MSRDALIVGINRYQYLPDLKAPALDAEAIAQRLEDDGEFDTLYRLPEIIIQGETKKPEIGEKGSVFITKLKQALTQLFLPKSQQIPKTALFYFSGHGLPDQDLVGVDKGYLAASDTNKNNPSSGLSLLWLQSLLSKSPIQQQIIWLDCCHSGSILVNVGAANPGHGESKDRCFIASSRDFEESWEDLNSPYSVLTKALLDGLDPKPLPGRWIDTFSLVDYVNQALKGELQTPVCTNFGEAINLTRSWQVQEESTSVSQVDSGICPYKGLEFFDCNDEDPKYFYGREQLVGQLLDQVRTSNFLALVGASGNGKSSVLRAGLLHQLKLGRRISGSEQWRIRIARPDRQPIQNLALAFVEEGLSDGDRAIALDKVVGLLDKGTAGLQRLVQASAAPRTVLVIDQFEEVFTRCENPEEREHFFACLMGALLDVDNKLCLIIAMRADFIVKCMEQEYSGLARLIDQQMVSVLPMKTNELRAAICRPAEQVDLQVESALVTEILNDIEGAPGSLPLLQYTLKELWNQRQDNQLTFASYQILGGIQGTLDQRATAIYNSFDKAEQQTVQHIFQQLTQLGEGTEDTRRRVFQDDLITEPKHPAQRVQQVIERLSSPENRLIVTSEVVSKSDQSTRMSIVDVAHEALIRHWKLLRQWIELNRDLLRKQRRIEASAISWRNQGQKSGYLLQGLPLIEAIQFNKDKSVTFPLSDNSKAFIQKSVRERRLNQLKAGAWLIVPALLILIVSEYIIRESGVSRNYVQLDGARSTGEKQAVDSLVGGCNAQKEVQWLPSYLAERLFGNCRPLIQAQLEHAKLRHADLRSAILIRANLFAADLNFTDFSDADLRYADLRRTDLNFTDFNHANLNFTKLGNANLNGTNLSDANLIGTNLYSADLRNAILIRANLFSTNLSNVNLYSADLSSTDMSSANLSNADLIRANLSGADLHNTDLFYANLSNANLSNANLSNAILLSSNLRETKNLTQAQLEGAEHPLICNSPLPQNIRIDRNRDCDKVAAVLHERYPQLFRDIEEAEKHVEEQRQSKWN
ncbi:nSTAND1 domain-containing NTPase [Acaryochloris marina]|uniref:Peptidase C14, caspase catalytic subunit p20 n=1 Tax=Acaryochloris marina (strain MBIC 11017) TaxID=329726 RepID=A8ZQQ6_ACAM1|nr:pentapeptide repeat-containing protein [Acaryochloris marina]ABW33342.1 peptidase C14, caspase catalytic subunit p20 [Acaryochloris marina MBIC11017]